MCCRTGFFYFFFYCVGDGGWSGCHHAAETADEPCEGVLESFGELGAIYGCVAEEEVAGLSLEFLVFLVKDDEFHARV